MGWANRDSSQVCTSLLGTPYIRVLYKKRLATVWRRRVGSWIFVSRLNRSRDSPPHTQDFHSHTQIKKKKKTRLTWRDLISPRLTHTASFRYARSHLTRTPPKENSHRLKRGKPFHSQSPRYWTTVSLPPPPSLSPPSRFSPPQISVDLVVFRKW